MKVGVILAGQAPAVGGGFTFVDDLIHALTNVESKHKFIVFGKAPEGNGQTREGTSKQTRFVSFQRRFLDPTKYKFTRIVAEAILTIPFIRNRFKKRYANWLKRAIKNLSIEVIWFIAPNYMALDIPYVLTVWDLQHRLQPWFPEVTSKGQWDIREEMYGTAIPRAAAVIVGTEVGKDEVVNFYRVPPDRVRLIPHPTPAFALKAPKDQGEEVLTRYNIPKGYLLYPAQFWPHKNHVGLLLAVKLLREQYGITLPVVLVGSDTGNLEHVRRVSDELNLSAQVHFLGFVSREDLIALYRNALALTYLTFFGPENLPPLEAFALGCPVIASNVSGSQEQLGDAALLVDPKDEKQIAAAIKRLLDDPVLVETLVSRGIARASRWTAEDFVRGVCSLFDEFESVRRCWGR